MKNLVIIKLGGSLITEKELPWPPITRKQTLARIAKEISSALKKKKVNLIIVHGAGNFGHPIVKQSKIDQGIKNGEKEKLLSLGKTQILQNTLNIEVCNELIKNNIPAFPYQPSSIITMEEKSKIKPFNTSIIKKLLSLGAIPVLYGVPAIDEKQNISILSGDDLLPYLAKELNATKIIYATTENGVYDKNEKTIPLITPKNYNNFAPQIKESQAEKDTTGGMMAKVHKIIKTNSIRALIINGNTKGTILSALTDKKTEGTTIET